MNFLDDIKKTSDLLMNTGEEKYQEIELDKILADPDQPRKVFDDIDDLAQSIKLHGVISPITVIKTEMDLYKLCYGERRYRASKKAGLKTIPAIVIDTLIDDIKEKQLVENVQRSELNVNEIADTIQYLIDEKKQKKKNIAKSLSKSNAYVTLYYNFSKIEPDIKELLLSKSKDITLIVEINKFLTNAEPNIYAMALDYLKSIDTINRNILDKLHNLDKADESDETPNEYNEYLVRPNIEDFIDDVAEDNNECDKVDNIINEDTSINENKSINENDYKYEDTSIQINSDNNVIIDEKHDSIEELSDIQEENNIMEDKEAKSSPKGKNKEVCSNIHAGQIYFKLNTLEICNTDDEVIIKITDKFYNILQENNKIYEFLDAMNLHLASYNIGE